ncbi:MAG: hypothetical protein ACE5HI_02135 [bacterium]
MSKNRGIEGLKKDFQRIFIAGATGFVGRDFMRVQYDKEEIDAYEHRSINNLLSISTLTFFVVKSNPEGAHRP